MTYLNLDDAWGDTPIPGETIDARQWGPKLRYITTCPLIEAFWREVGPRLDDFVLYGSGDFHHLAGVLIRRVKSPKFTLVSFDNHPDWDVRPPYWSCGGWAARALRSPPVEQVSVWGCGNFELRWPSRMFADWRAIRSGKFHVNAWAERQSAAVQKRFDCMSRENWRERFSSFADGLRGRDVYITVDMDCLGAEEAVTNWENGLFRADDIAWAIGELRQASSVVGGDLCGAYSEPVHSRWGQRFAGKWDHPKISLVDLKTAQDTNRKALNTVWSVFVDK